MRYVIPISGKDSLATAIVQMARRDDLDYEFLFNKTGFELPDTLVWLEKVEGALGIGIERVGADLEGIIREKGILPAPRTRYCTRLAKIQPMEAHIGDDPATVFYGLRADEPHRVGYQARGTSTIVAAYPLREMGMGIMHVWRVLSDRDLLPPAYHWQWLEDEVRRILGDYQAWIDQLKPWERRTLFAWRSRDNCYNCFNMRQYEVVGLAEHYPDLFEASCQLEESVGAEGYTLHQGHSLRSFAEPAKAERIKRRRAIDVAKTLFERFSPAGTFAPSQMILPMEIEETGAMELDILSVTSCGLLCGK